MMKTIDASSQSVMSESTSLRKSQRVIGTTAAVLRDDGGRGREGRDRRSPSQVPSVRRPVKLR